MREANRAGSFHHPNLLPPYEVGEHEGVLVLATRAINAVSLERVLTHQGPLPPQRVAAILRQVGAGLDSAHGRGLVHRDVNPGNVLIVADGDFDRVYVTGFGLTEVTEGSGLLNGATLTAPPAYGFVAPEQVRGDAADGRADVYSLGCVAFAALTGRRPFGDQPEKDLARRLEGPPPSAKAAAPSLPEEMDKAIAKAMAVSPADRFPTAGEFAAALGAGIEGGTSAPRRSMAAAGGPTPAPAPAPADARPNGPAAAPAKPPESPAPKPAVAPPTPAPRGRLPRPAPPTPRPRSRPSARRPSPPPHHPRPPRRPTRPAPPHPRRRSRPRAQHPSRPPPRPRPLRRQHPRRRRRTAATRALACPPGRAALRPGDRRQAPSAHPARRHAGPAAPAPVPAACRTSAPGPIRRPGRAEARSARAGARSGVRTAPATASAAGQASRRPRPDAVARGALEAAAVPSRRPPMLPSLESPPPPLPTAEGPTRSGRRGHPSPTAGRKARGTASARGRQARPHRQGRGPARREGPPREGLA